MGPILMVGAGMAGMTLGIALKQRGFDCEITEIRPALASLSDGRVGMGLAVQPR